MNEHHKQKTGGKQTNKSKVGTKIEREEKGKNSFINILVLDFN